MIGAQIAKQLLQRGWQVRGLTRRQHFSMPGVEAVYGSITDTTLVHRFVKEADAVFHCAAELTDCHKMWQVNVQGARILLQAVAKHHIGYLCHMSSAGVTGLSRQQWVNEDTPCNPRNDYEKSKWEAEKLVRAGIEGTSTCILRPTNVVSCSNPGVVKLGIHNQWLDRLNVHIKGRECAHLVHAKDVAAAALFPLGKKLTHPKCFIVSCDDDAQNTVADIYALSRAQIQGESKAGRPWSFPAGVPYLARKLIRRDSLHGNVRFSPARLKAEGFQYSFDVKAMISNICSLHCKQ